MKYLLCIEAALIWRDDTFDTLPMSGGGKSSAGIRLVYTIVGSKDFFSQTALARFFFVCDTYRSIYEISEIIAQPCTGILIKSFAAMVLTVKLKQIDRNTLLQLYLTRRTR